MQIIHADRDNLSRDSYDAGPEQFAARVSAYLLEFPSRRFDHVYEAANCTLSGVKDTHDLVKRGDGKEKTFKGKDIYTLTTKSTEYVRRLAPPRFGRRGAGTGGGAGKLPKDDGSHA